MSYKIEISDGAETDIKDAMYYYKTKASLKVSQGFLIDFKEQLRSLKINPFYRFYYKNVRGIPLKKYPYIIFFTVNEIKKQISIIAVFNTYQDTQKRP